MVDEILVKVFIETVMSPRPARICRLSKQLKHRQYNFFFAITGDIHDTKGPSLTEEDCICRL